MKEVLQELRLKQENYMVNCDCYSVIHLCKNQTFNSRSKHIDVKYDWIGNVLEEKQLQL